MCAAVGVFETIAKTGPPIYLNQLFHKIHLRQPLALRDTDRLLALDRLSAPA